MVVFCCRGMPFEDINKVNKFMDLLGMPVPVENASTSSIPQSWDEDGSKFYRQCIEGVNNTDPYPSVLEKHTASIANLHGRAHAFIGGHLFSSFAPQDPIFFLLHMNIDRLWATAQQQDGFDDWWFNEGEGASLVDTPMFAFGNRTVRDVLDHTAGGYTYDTIMAKETPLVQVSIPAP